MALTLLRCLWAEVSHQGELRRCNARTRQEAGTNMCGLFVIAFMESEAAEGAGCGPASTGWP